MISNRWSSTCETEKILRNPYLLGFLIISNESNEDTIRFRDLSPRSVKPYISCIILCFIFIPLISLLFTCLLL